MKYRQLKTGEVVEKTDEYISVYAPKVFITVKDCTVGQNILECNAKYYRRPIKI